MKFTLISGKEVIEVSRRVKYCGQSDATVACEASAFIIYPPRILKDEGKLCVAAAAVLAQGWRRCWFSVSVHRIPVNLWNHNLVLRLPVHIIISKLAFCVPSINFGQGSIEMV